MSGIYIPALKPEDWSRFLAEPKHWKKGYSAMSLAMCWQEADGFPESVTTVFNQSDFKQLHDIELLLAIPEHKVPLPGGAAASQNDLFILAKGGGSCFQSQWKERSLSPSETSTLMTGTKTLLRVK